MLVPDQQSDPEWEQEKPLWEAEQGSDLTFRTAHSPEEFKQLLLEFFNDNQDLTHDE